MTIRQIKIEIFKFFRPLFPSRGGTFKSQVKEGNDALAEEDYKYYFESKDRDPIYQIQINNNLPIDQGMFSSSQVTCDYCGKQHKNSNCAFDFTETSTLR